MSPSLARTALSVLLVSAAACSDKQQHGAAGKSVAVPTEPTVASELPLRDYWKPVSTLLSGSYGGTCTSKPGDKPSAAHIALAPDGSFTAPGYSNNLVTSAQTTLTHQRIEGGPSTLVVEGIGSDFVVKLSSGADGQGNTVEFHQGQSKLACEQSKATIALTGKHLYAVYARELDTAPRKIHCVKVGELKMADLDYQFSDGVAKLAGDTFELAKMNEHVMLMNASSVLSYTASTDANEINVILDKHGKLISVQARGKNGQVYSCPIEA